MVVVGLQLRLGDLLVDIRIKVIWSISGIGVVARFDNVDHHLVHLRGVSEVMCWPTSELSRILVLLNHM